MTFEVLDDAFEKPGPHAPGRFEGFLEAGPGFPELKLVHANLCACPAKKETPDNSIHGENESDPGP